MEQLVRSSPPLDPNSTYLYLILFTHFSGTCLIARFQNQIIGFVTAYRPPEHPETLFVWQVGVRSDLRGQGVGRRMLKRLLTRNQIKSVKYLETTVGPSNLASKTMFQKLAQELKAPFREDLLFSAEDFGERTHEAENLVRIGPIPLQNTSNFQKEDT